MDIINQQPEQPLLAIERIKLGANDIELPINLLSQRDGESWVLYSPSISVSGYGSTPMQAKKLYDISLSIFKEDMMTFSAENQRKELIRLGWMEKPSKKFVLYKTGCKLQ